MADRTNHYERAFGSHLYRLRISCISINESHRSFDAESTVKNPDFIVNLDDGRNLLIDVKGRKIAAKRKTRENWATLDDVRGLGIWQRKFGATAEALLVFVYLLASEEFSEEFVDHFIYESRHYGCLAIPLADYERAMKQRSPRWGTVSLSSQDFKTLAQPFSFWLTRSPAPPEIRGI